jgi:Mrp family chromosome partitioning ATPase/capsular polysaccharide biosynthesis protein
MTSGAEAFKAALKRSALLIAALILLGAATLTIIRQLQGPRYAASARVLVSQQSLGEVITGTQPPFVDPQRAEQMARALAQSPELYDRAAARTGHSFGSGSEFRDATSVSVGGDNILTFTSTADHSYSAVAIANSVATSYIGWRAEVLGKPIRQAIDDVRAKLRPLGASTSTAANELRKQLNTLELLQTLNNDTTLVDRASSAAKTRPTPIRDGFLGAAIGLVIALLLVAAREAIDTTVRTEGDVEDILGAPVLASVRSLPRRARLVTYGRHEALFGDTYALLAATIAQGVDTPRVLAVTSAISSEGKTTTASNLAVALARRGKRVILADFDFRKASLGSVFGIPRDAPGTLQVLSRAVSTSKAVWEVTLDGPKPTIEPLESVAAGNGATATRTKAAGAKSNGIGGRLWVLPAGGTQRTHAPFNTRRLAALLEELRKRADFVVLDTPPALLTAEMADIADAIDSALVVVRHGRVTHRSLRSLTRQARSWGAELTGAVMTDAGGDEQYGYYGGR